MKTARNRFALAVATAALCAVLPAASASAALIETSPCDGAQLSQPFAAFGDNAYYKLVPGGDFESGLGGWSVNGNAKVVSGGHSGRYALSLRAKALPAGGLSSSTTPASCVNAGAPSFRFFSKSSGGLLGLVPVLKVDLVYRDSVLGLVALPLGTAVPSGTFKPSLSLLTASVVAGLLSDGQADLAFRFTSVLGTWTVDDVWVDPYTRN